jgi:hypothetical protein
MLSTSPTIPIRVTGGLFRLGPLQGPADLAAGPVFARACRGHDSVLEAATSGPLWTCRLRGCTDIGGGKNVDQHLTTQWLSRPPLKSLAMVGASGFCSPGASCVPHRLGAFSASCTRPGFRGRLAQRALTSNFVSENAWARRESNRHARRLACPPAHSRLESPPGHREAIDVIDGVTPESPDGTRRSHERSH